MKENNVNNYDEKRNIKSEDIHLTNNERAGGYDKFKNRMKALFNEFEQDNNKNSTAQTSSVLNFSEHQLELKDGCNAIIILLIIIIISIVLIVVFAIVGKACYFIIPVPGLCLLICPFIFCCNLITIPPGYALVLTYYGKYMGTCKKPGYYWIKPCSDKSLISLKSEQFNGNMLKVNDKDGTPVSIGVVSVYHINDTVKATYGVKDSHSFMQAQTESAIRFIANKFKYDSNEENEPTLKSGNEEINELLKLELQRRTKIAGIEIEDARITEISYGQYKN